MKRPVPHDRATGQFVSRRSPDFVDELNHDDRVVQRRLARRGLRLDTALFGGDRKIALAIRRETEALGGELGEGPLLPSAAALISSIVLTRVRRDTMALFVVELGPRAFNRARREAYKIVAQLNDLERLLAELLVQFEELKANTVFARQLRELKALEARLDG